MDDVSILALAVAQGTVPEAVLAEWRGRGPDAATAIWQASRDPVGMVELAIAVGHIDERQPADLVFELLTRYADGYQPAERALILGAVNSASHGRHPGTLREDLETAFRFVSDSLHWVPINAARRLVSAYRIPGGVASDVRSFAGMEASPDCPFERHLVAILHERFPPITTEDVYGAAVRNDKEHATLARTMPRARRGGAVEAIRHNPTSKKRR